MSRMRSLDQSITTSVVGLAILLAAAQPGVADEARVSPPFPPGPYVLGSSSRPATGRQVAEIKQPFTLQPGQYILSGGPNPTDRIVVDDDLELHLGEWQVFVDDDRIRSTERDEGCTYQGWPIILGLPARTRLCVRAIDRAASQAILGELYLHRHDGVKKRLIAARQQESNRKLPFTFVDEEFELDRLFDSPSIMNPPEILADEQLKALWEDLGGRDAVTAYFALWQLVAAPGQAVPFMKDRLQPVSPADSQRLLQLLADLDSDRFRVREQATRDLKGMEKLARPALQQALQRRPSPEVRRRADELLARIQHAIRTPETIRALRAVEVLEHIGTPEARSILKRLVEGAPEARLTLDAGAALKRLDALPR